MRGLIDYCEWYEVYDIIEEIHADLQRRSDRRDGNADPVKFESEINKYFRREGIGWKLEGGRIEVRGDREFEASVHEAAALLEETSRPTAAGEIREALNDLSKRPDPDRTGAIQHALAALECVARDVAGDERATLGALISRGGLNIPQPLDTALEKLWGFASEQGRHLREGREPSEEEAELAVIVSAAVARYIIRKSG